MEIMTDCQLEGRLFGLAFSFLRPVDVALVLCALF